MIQFRIKLNEAKCRSRLNQIGETCCRYRCTSKTNLIYNLPLIFHLTNYNITESSCDWHLLKTTTFCLSLSAKTLFTIPPTETIYVFRRSETDANVFRHDLHRRSNVDLFNVQPTELIVDTVENKFVRSLCFGFLIPNGHTSIVGLNLNTIVFHDQYAETVVKMMPVSLYRRVTSH